MAAMVIKIEEYTKLVNALEVIRFVTACIEKDKYMFIDYSDLTTHREVSIYFKKEQKAYNVIQQVDEIAKADSKEWIVQENSNLIQYIWKK